MTVRGRGREWVPSTARSPGAVAAASPLEWHRQFGRAAVRGTRLPRTFLPPSAGRAAPAAGTPAERGGAGGEREELAAGGWEAALGASRSAERSARAAARGPAGSPQPGRAEQRGAVRSGAAPPGITGLFGAGLEELGLGRCPLPDGIHLSAAAASPWTAGETVPRREPALSRERTGMTF